jgi:hypothetical protein
VQPSSAVTVTCDTLVEFAEDAAEFAQGEPEFVNGAAPATSAQSAAANAPPAHPASNQEPRADSLSP